MRPKGTADNCTSREEIFLDADSFVRDKRLLSGWSSKQATARTDKDVGSSGEALGRMTSGLETGDLIDSKYEVIRLIGEGGMGKVFEVHHRLIKRRGALKCLHPYRASDPEIVARFVHEAQAAAAIGSEHIIDVTDAGVTTDGIPYLVMEYLDGHDFGQELRDKLTLPPERAAKLLVQACKALAAAHAKGIIHRDLKPENILVAQREDGSEVVKVLDFGMAKFHDLRITGDGDTLGSPFFMAPEQFGGAADIDHRADIYALGVILYELVTGEVPFKGPSMGELVYQVMMTEPVKPQELNSHIPALLESIILKAMAREQDERYANMDELSEALTEFLETLPRQSCPPKPKMALLKAGSFMMGSPEDAADRFDDEVLHEVVLSHSFLVQLHPVTQAEWKAVMASNPSHFIGNDRPVEMVSWYDAVAFCNALSALHGLQPAYILADVVGQPGAPDYCASVEWRCHETSGYRLPTEAEWEYACRAEGSAERPLDLQLDVWFKENSGGGTHPVARKRANGFGLFDMLGNVWEWCWDWYESYPEQKVIDPIGPHSAFGRVDRGGGWDSQGRLCRPADRDGFLAASRSNNLGFRLAQTVMKGDD